MADMQSKSLKSIKCPLILRENKLARRSFSERNLFMERHAAFRASTKCKNALVLIALGVWLCLPTARAFAAADPAPCSANSQSRQLDYWLGDWTVTYPGAPGASTSKVYLALDQCLLVESWGGGKDHAGENMFAYSSDDKSWHGMFADNQGRVHVFEGNVTAGSAEFHGPSRGPNGETVLNRIKVVQISADKIEQSWEKSVDNGATWKMEFRGEYSRKKP
jgi:hypothetical protein